MIHATTSKVGGGTTPVMKRSSSRLRNIFYWITTVYIALAMFVGGFSEVFDASMNIELSSIGIATVVAVLGYPLYFVYIIGIAKILGAIVIIVPKFPRLKEWAYAGLVINMTGAFLSWLIVTVVQGAPIPEGYGAPAFHAINALHLIVVIMVSWLLRPDSRTLGNISHRMRSSD
ncbi:DoxX family protein [Salinibacterium sp.]|uniref:DoxX family protein n=1 Tax=Salinibacterium sp. TaxID=1915057 RepID=UPI00286BA0BB|nr:DoxX family protein [Salinibacterium sp.]